MFLYVFAILDSFRAVLVSHGQKGLLWGRLWEAFGVPLGDFRLPLGLLGHPWAPFGLALGPLGSLWAHFGAPLVSLWMPWVPFGVILDRLGSFLWCLGSQMHALGMICKSCHDVLDMLSNIMILFVIFLSVFLCHVTWSRPHAARSKTTRYDRIISEFVSLILDFCLYMFAAMLWGSEFMSALPVPMLSQVSWDPLKRC